MKKNRINVFLARALGLSRRRADRLIEAGQVTVGDRRAIFSDMVDEADDVRVAGERLARPRTRWLALNKPRELLTAKSDARRKTVMDLLPPDCRELFPVGRLDADSRGLLLLTNDGAAAERLLHPRYAAPRVYHVLLSRDPDLALARKGVRLEEGWSRFDAVRPLGEKRLEVTLHQGWKRQIRRTFQALGCRVLDLVRVRMGDITLGDLPEGEWRELTAAERRRVEKRHG